MHREESLKLHTEDLTRFGTYNHDVWYGHGLLVDLPLRWDYLLLVLSYYVVNKEVRHSIRSFELEIRNID